MFGRKFRNASKAKNLEEIHGKARQLQLSHDTEWMKRSCEHSLISAVKNITELNGSVGRSYLQNIPREKSE